MTKLDDQIEVKVEEGGEINGIPVDRVVSWIDKSTWGEGPWQAEPDKLQWADQATGLPCLAVRNAAYGHWCGYVGVDDSHPVFGEDWQELPPFDIHRGINYSAFCQEDDQQIGICHVPRPGQPDRVWWLGFHCAGGYDMLPAFEARTAQRFGSALILPGQEYRDLAYVQAECARLAEQVRALEGAHA